MNASPRRTTPLLVLLSTAQFLVVLNTSIVNVALGPLGGQWRLSSPELSWVINAYLLPFGGLLLLGGRLGDLRGRRSVLLAGAAVLTLASAAAAFAPGIAVLLAARAGQGIGAALLAPTALAIVVVLFDDPAARNRALGVIGAVSGLGGAAGVLFGGVLTEAFGWRAVFALTAVLGVGLIGWAVRLLPADGPAPAPGRALDLPGAALVTTGVTAVVFGLSNGARAGSAVAVTAGALLAGVVLLAAFVGRQRRAADPLVRLGVLRTARVGAANGLMLLLGAVWVGFFFFLPLLQQRVLGYPPLTTGLSQLPLALSTVGASALAPGLARRVGPRAALAGALTLLAAGLLWMGAAGGDAGFLTDLLGPSLLVGAGLGLAFVNLTTLGVSGVAPAESGLASGLINTSRQVGGGLGLALLAASATLAARTGDGTATDALIQGFRWAFRTGSAIAALAVVVALLTIPAPTPRRSI